MTKTKSGTERVLSVFLAILMLVTCLPFSENLFKKANALGYNGTGVSISGATGSAVKSDNFYLSSSQSNAADSCVGYRFSVVDAAGNTVLRNDSTRTVDLYRDTDAYNNYSKPAYKYN